MIDLLCRALIVGGLAYAGSRLMTRKQRAPANWYPDPWRQATWRWWDGDH
jgi:hypothetical protein